METSNGCKNNKKKTTWSGFLLILLLQVEVQNLFKEVSPRWANSKTDILLQGFNIFNINRQLCWVIHKNQQPFLQDMEQTQNTSTRPVCSDPDLNMRLLKHLLHTLSDAKIPLWVQAVWNRHEATTAVYPGQNL